MGLGKKTIDDQNYCGKKVLVRCVILNICRLSDKTAAAVGIIV